MKENVSGCFFSEHSVQRRCDINEYLEKSCTHIYAENKSVRVFKTVHNAP